ncbi:MAG: DUF4234 domain-containing protein [Lachnospiraceae bacterium]|nr:DUF4234 domain-containing protein [Lachnospiraceae bacterium]
MFCPKCGKENGSQNSFCFNCGVPLPVTKENGITNEPENTNENVIAITPDTGRNADITIDSKTLKLVLSASGVIIAFLYLWFALRGILPVFSGVTAVLRGRVPYGILNIAGRALAVLSRLVMAAGFLLYALSRDDERDNTESLLLTVILCAFLRIVLLFSAQTVSGLSAFVRFGRFAFNGISFGKAVLYAFLAAGIEIGLTFLAGYRPFLGKTANDLLPEIKKLPGILLDETEILGRKYRERTARRRSPVKEGAYHDMSSQKTGAEPMNEKRSYLAFVLLGIITCGIYPLYVVYTIGRDVNILCKEDGETTPGLLRLILLSLVTCGIYSFVWYYRLLNRVEKQEENWGVTIQTFGSMELGTCWVAMKLVGILVSICGIGVLISCYADYLMFCNLNELSKEYNRRTLGWSGTEV